mmetsp:Transcript_9545/g.15081  ORF Transcript_9545/g.15081 Transcript_9545/m.15081 type:complete len:82 (+) Transcript_9545:49-294(+)
MTYKITTTSTSLSPFNLSKKQKMQMLSHIPHIIYGMGFLLSQSKITLNEWHIHPMVFIANHKSPSAPPTTPTPSQTRSSVP